MAPHKAHAEVCEIFVTPASAKVAYFVAKTVATKCKPGDTLSVFPSSFLYEIAYLCSLDAQVLHFDERLVCQYKPTPPPEKP